MTEKIQLTPQYENRFFQLRATRLVRATRPFKARGCMVQRCEHCLLAQRLCICPWIKPSQINVGFCLLMHRQEILKPTNTGRLIADVFSEDTFAFEWQRTQIDPDLERLLNSEEWFPILVFPEEYIRGGSLLSSSQVKKVMQQKKRPLFVILDGTWAQCKKMYRSSSYLQALPAFSLSPQKESEFKLRKAPEASHLCTVEVAMEVLNAIEFNQQACHLSHYYQIFNRHYFASRKSQTVALDSENHQYIEQL